MHAVDILDLSSPEQDSKKETTTLSALMMFLVSCKNVRHSWIETIFFSFQSQLYSTLTTKTRQHEKMHFGRWSCSLARPLLRKKQQNCFPFFVLPLLLALIIFTLDLPIREGSLAKTPVTTHTIHHLHTLTPPGMVFKGGGK